MNFEFDVIELWFKLFAMYRIHVNSMIMNVNNVMWSIDDPTNYWLMIKCKLITSKNFHQLMNGSMQVEIDSN